jgi:hypothetical protein
VYTEWKSWSKSNGQKGRLAFKDQIHPDLVPMVKHQLKLDDKAWKKIADKELVKMLQTKLHYSGADYYLRQLENLKMASVPQDPASNLLSAFIDFSTPFVKVIDDAKQNKITLTQESVMSTFKLHIKDYPTLKRWFQSQKFDSLGDAISYITDKLKERVETQEQQDHDRTESEKKTAAAAGIRSDFQGGKVESSRAQGPKNRELKNAGVKKDKKSDDKQKAFEYEKALGKGMYWHMCIGRCKDQPCTAKFCQGCGWHAFGSKGHARPNCPHCKHPDFVAKGYYHDKYPKREDSIVSKTPASPAAAPNSKSDSNVGGRVRAATANTSNEAS